VDLNAYLKGKKRDPRKAMEYAALCFNSGDLKTGLVTLVSALGYDDMPEKLALAMTRRVAMLIDARDETDPKEAEKLAESTRWPPESDDAFNITYFPTVRGFSPPWRVNLPDVWSRMLHEFVNALRTDQRTKADH
jgi:hypothetical protein